MKILKKYLAVLYFIILTVSFSFLKCGTTPELSPQVCNVGIMICDIANNICTNFPIPSTVCNYINLACLNITVLCNTAPGSPAYLEAEKNLEENAEIINEAMQKYKRLYPEILDSLKNINQK